MRLIDGEIRYTLAVGLDCRLFLDNADRLFLILKVTMLINEAKMLIDIDCYY